jgi:hypothetical protein
MVKIAEQAERYDGKLSFYIINQAGGGNLS